MTARLSSRGEAASSDSAGSKIVWEVCANLWSPHSNPDGWVSLGVAENALMHGSLRDFLSTKCLVDNAAKGLTYGDGPSGSKELVRALAGFINRHFHPAIHVQDHTIVVTNGVTSAIEHTAWALANAGDGILLGRPYYRAFMMDMEQRAGVRTIAVSFGPEIDPCGPDCVAAYEAALLKSNAEGLQIRALLLCHPHNPLGRCYSRDTLIALMKLCQKYNIHFISDEIYALTVWENLIDTETQSGPPEPFISALSIDKQGIIDPSLVHVLWGTSKDFGANGLRLGVIVSQSNDAFLEACRSNGLFSAPSSLAENAVTQLLNNRSFVENYIKTNQQKLSQAYAYTVSKLKEIGVEYKPGVNAAFFLWINLGKSWGKQVNTNAIYQALLQKKVFIVPGDAAGAEEAGWFRLAFAQSAELINECIRRIGQVLAEQKLKSSQG